MKNTNSSNQTMHGCTGLLRIRCIILFFTCLLLSACVDSDYDLSNIEADNISVGNDNTEYKMPLVNFYASTNDMIVKDYDIVGTCNNIKKWLPDNLPNVDAQSPQKFIDYYDIELFWTDNDYVSRTLIQLYEEMDDNKEKIDAIIDMIWKEYKADFVKVFNSLVPDGMPKPDYSNNKELFAEAFIASYHTNDVINLLREKFIDYLSTYFVIEDYGFDLGKINIEDDVLNSLIDNLDPDSVSNPSSALYLYGSVTNDIPLSFVLTVQLLSEPNKEVITEFDINVSSKDKSPFGENRNIRIYGDDLRAVVNGFTLNAKARPTRFYVKEEIGGVNSNQILININLLKTGSLKYNF